MRIGWLTALALLLGASCVPPTAQTRVAVVSAAAAAPIHHIDGPGFSAEIAPPIEEIAAAIAPGAAAKPFAMEGERASAEKALGCLTAAVYYEARSETEDGQRAVAQVVLNRVRHPGFPNSVCGVVYEGSARSTGCQFSFTCDGSMARGREPGPWTRARRIAAEALGGYVYAPVGLATHYHTTAIRPWWAASMNRAVTIGSHIFYRWRGEWGDPKSFRRPYGGIEFAHSVHVSAPDEGGDVPVRREAGVAVHRNSLPSIAASVSTGGGGQVTVHRGTAAAERVEARAESAAGSESAPAALVLTH
jgi:spore germination cell wall hydrolase CwlJ-like protein